MGPRRSAAPPLAARPPARLSRALLDPGGRQIVEQATPPRRRGVRRAPRQLRRLRQPLRRLARELGVPAYFVLVDASLLLAATRPLTFPTSAKATWRPLGPGRGPPDLRPRGRDGSRRLAVRPITDLAAIALFYSNRGVEALLEGRVVDAIDWLRAAAELEPSACPHLDQPRVALRRAGELEAANDAYQRALELDPAGGAAYRNLAALLTLRGRPHEAADLLDTAAALSRLDSLAALRLARQRLLEGHLREARGLYRRALETSQLSPRR